MKAVLTTKQSLLCQCMATKYVFLIISSVCLHLNPTFQLWLISEHLIKSWEFCLENLNEICTVIFKHLNCFDRLPKSVHTCTHVCIRACNCVHTRTPLSLSPPLPTSDHTYLSPLFLILLLRTCHSLMFSVPYIWSLISLIKGRDFPLPYPWLSWNTWEGWDVCCSFLLNY